MIPVLSHVPYDGSVEKVFLVMVPEVMDDFDINAKLNESCALANQDGEYVRSFFPFCHADEWAFVLIRGPDVSLVGPNSHQYIPGTWP